MTTTTLRRVQIVDTHLDLMWNAMRMVLKVMPDALRHLVDEVQLRARFLRFRHTAEVFVIDVNARKQLLHVSGRRLVTRFILAALLWG